MSPSFDIAQSDLGIESVGDAVPAGFWSWTIPINSIIQPVALTFVHVTDANVGDRHLVVSMGNIITQSCRSLCPIVQVASTTRNYWVPRIPIPAFEVAAEWLIQFPMPNDVYLRAGEIFTILSYNGKIGDAVTSALLRYRRWITE